MYLVTSIPIIPPPWKKDIYIYFIHIYIHVYFLCGRKIFAIIIFALFVSFGFWSYFFPSCSCLPSQSFKILGFVHEPFEHLWCPTYSLLSSYVSRKQFPKENLFIVFGVKLRILLHFPVSGSGYLFPDFVLGI